MIRQYVEEALRGARYDKLEDGTFYGEVPRLRGVLATAETLEDCRDQLAEVVGEGEEGGEGRAGGPPARRELIRGLRALGDPEPPWKGHWRRAPVSSPSASRGDALGLGERVKCLGTVHAPPADLIPGRCPCGAGHGRERSPA